AIRHAPTTTVYTQAYRSTTKPTTWTHCPTPSTTSPHSTRVAPTHSTTNNPCTAPATATSPTGSHTGRPVVSHSSPNAAGGQHDGERKNRGVEMECPQCGLDVLAVDGQPTPHLNPDTL